MYGGLAFVAFGGQQNTTCSTGQAAVSKRGVIMKTNLKKTIIFTMMTAAFLAIAGSFGMFDDLQGIKADAGEIVRGTLTFLPPDDGEDDEEEKSDSKIFPGVHIDDIDVSGMTEDEARTAVEDYIAQLSASQVTLVVAQDTEVPVTVADLSPVWSNPEVVSQAAENTTDGNVIARYKMKKDIEHNGLNFPLEITFDDAALSAYLEENCSIYDIPVENPTLVREGNDFTIINGEGGQGLDIPAAVAQLEGEFYADYRAGQTTINLPVVATEPDTSVEDLAKVHDLLGSFTTSYSSSGSNRSGNVANGCRLINGTVLYPGEEFSAYETIKPFTEENGYFLAGSYLNGQVVESLGGGICQVSSTLYNAVLRAELQVVERNSHSMVVNYVDKSADAAIAESSGKDFRFVNNTDYPIYIEGYTENKKITFNIYGVETRDPGRKVEFESEIVTETVPDHEDIVADASQPIGYVSATSAHIGYTAKLWKIVYENGVEVSREVVNNSTYKATPRTAVVGIASDNPEYTAAMQAAIATGSIDNCKAMAAQLNEMAAAAAAQAAMDQSASVDP